MTFKQKSHSRTVASAISYIVFFGLFTLTTAAYAEIHQWRDADGNLNFGDEPPEASKSTLIELDVPPPADPIPTADNMLEQQLMEEEEDKATQRLVEQIKQKKAAKQRLKQAQELARQQRCMEGRELLAVLQQEMPVFRDEQGHLQADWEFNYYQGNRDYISDKDRPQEIDIATQIVYNNCDEPDSIEQQEQVYDNWRNAQYCQAAQVELVMLQQPNKRSSKQTIRDKELDIEKYCYH